MEKSPVFTAACFQVWEGNSLSEPGSAVGRKLVTGIVLPHFPRCCAGMLSCLRLTSNTSDTRNPVTNREKIAENLPLYRRAWNGWVSFQ